MTPLADAELERFVRICGMLGSAFPGERAVAAEKASEFLRSRKLTWQDVLAPQPVVQPQLSPVASAWRRIARECLAIDAEVDALSDWEHRFCHVIAERCWPPTTKQLRVLTRIAAGLGVDPQ